MRQGMRRIGGAAGIALAATLAIAPSASASTDEPEDQQPAKPAGVVLAPQPLVGVRIAIDPGHEGEQAEDLGDGEEEVADGRGGRTDCSPPGSVSSSGYAEHEFTWEVSQKLAQQLRDRGAIVSLTRLADDAGPCVDDRGTFALDHDVDLMLSIHSEDADSEDADSEDADSEDADAEDAATDGSETQEWGSDPLGFQVVVAAPPQSDSQRDPSHDLAESMTDALQEAGYAPRVGDRAASGRADDVASDDADERGSDQSTADDGAEEDAAGYLPLPDGVVARSDVTTLNFARRPAVRLELGDLREDSQAEEMSTDQAQEDYAEAMTSGVLDWLDSHRFLQDRHDRQDR